MGVNGWKECKEQLGKCLVEFYENYKSCKRMEINDFNQSNVINIIDSVSSDKTSNAPAKKEQLKVDLFHSDGGESANKN